MSTGEWSNERSRAVGQVVALLCPPSTRLARLSGSVRVFRHIERLPRMPPESPPAKRRRTSSPPPPPRRASPTLHRPSHSPEAPRPRRKNPLEGFDDEQELPHERDERERDEALLARTTAAAAAGEGGGDGDGDDDEEHCAICLSPIENKVRRRTLVP